MKLPKYLKITSFQSKIGSRAGIREWNDLLVSLFTWINTVGEDYSSLTQWDQTSFHEELIEPRLVRITDKTGVIFLMHCLLMEGQLHGLGKYLLSSVRVSSRVSGIWQSEIHLTQQWKWKCLVNTRAPTAELHSWPALTLATVGT